MSTKLTKREVADLEAMMLPYGDSRRREQEWRDNGKHLVVCVGILSYRVLSEHETEEAAQGSLSWWRDKVRRGLPIHPLTRTPSEHDLTVWTQEGLDNLTRAILDGYEHD